VFDGRQACRLNDWSCRSARRIMVDLGAPGGPADKEALAGLRQELDFQDDELSGLLRAMVREVAEDCPHGALYAETLSVGVLQRLQDTQGRERRERGALSAAQLRRVDALIAECEDGGPTLTAMADAVGYSRAQFVRLFHRSTGTTPHRYVMQQRLARAQHLILNSALPLAEVAWSTGFASQSHLNGAFARAFGSTPGAARRQRRA
jgi:AraC family transcriptional regulator